jgi:hypothetical protein
VIDYEAAEPLILTLLAPLQSAGVIVRGMPDEAQQQGTVATSGPVVVHGWFGSTPEGRGSLDGQAQALSNQIVFEIRTPKLRGPLGQYQLPNRVRKLLQGQQVAGLGMLRFAGWQMQGRGDGPNNRGYTGVMSFTVVAMEEVR